MALAREAEIRELWEALRTLVPRVPAVEISPSPGRRWALHVDGAEVIRLGGDYNGMDATLRSAHIARAFAIALCLVDGVAGWSNRRRHYNRRFDAVAASIGLYRPWGTTAGPLNHLMNDHLAQHLHPHADHQEERP